MDKNDLKMPTEQELAEIVYDYCKKNNVTRTEVVRRGIIQILSEEK